MANVHSFATKLVTRRYVITSARRKLRIARSTNVSDSVEKDAPMFARFVSQKMKRFKNFSELNLKEKAGMLK